MFCAAWESCCRRVPLRFTWEETREATATWRKSAECCNKEKSIRDFQLHLHPLIPVWFTITTNPSLLIQVEFLTLSLYLEYYLWINWKMTNTKGDQTRARLISGTELILIKYRDLIHCSFIAWFGSLSREMNVSLLLVSRALNCPSLWRIINTWIFTMCVFMALKPLVTVIAIDNILSHDSCFSRCCMIIYSHSDLSRDLWFICGCIIRWHIEDICSTIESPSANTGSHGITSILRTFASIRTFDRWEQITQKRRERRRIKVSQYIDLRWSRTKMISYGWVHARLWQLSFDPRESNDAGVKRKY